jgi:hypothetical protein
MLDVNTEQKGDIETFFTPYNSDVNLNVFKMLCERYGVEISQEAAKGVIQHIESFKCAD